MLWLVVLLFIGKAFYNLKEQSKKGKWQYAFYGILCYSVSFFIPIIIFVLVRIVDEGLVGPLPALALNLICFPFGLLSSWGLYKYLQNKMAKVGIFTDSTVLDADMIDRT